MSNPQGLLLTMRNFLRDYWIAVVAAVLAIAFAADVARLFTGCVR